MSNVYIYGIFAQHMNLNLQSGLQLDMHASIRDEKFDAHQH